MAGGSFQIEKVSATISAILRVSAVENGARKHRGSRISISAAILREVVDFYEPLAEFEVDDDTVDADDPFPFAATRT